MWRGEEGLSTRRSNLLCDGGDPKDWWEREVVDGMIESFAENDL